MCLISPPQLRHINLMKKYLVEFIGTFFLVLTVGMTVIDPGRAARLRRWPSARR